MDYLLSCRKEAGSLPKNAVAVKTIVTSDLAYPIAESYGAAVIDVLTGFKYIGEVIGRMEAEGRMGDFILGFEESCGYLAGVHVRDKDGVMTAMLVLDMAEHHKRGGATLLSALEALYGRYGHEANGVINIDIESVNPMARMGEIMAKLRGERRGALAGAPMESATDYIDGVDGLPPSNMLVYRDIGGGKAIVRPSGTEPKLKIYLSARAPDAHRARSRLSELEKEVRGWCS
jgi:phosphoglucomutase